MRLINGRYELRELVGKGGMAEVWGSWDLQLRRQVAVKVLDSGSLLPLEKDARLQQERFMREAHIAAQMYCTNIVMVHDAGVFLENGRRSPFLVMEFIHGENLRQHMRDPDNWSLPRIAGILEDALNGLVYAHSKQVVHRDIKPENIMICADGTAKLADFGIAIEMRETIQRLTHDQRALGTQRYAAPEYLRSGQITHLSDVYSFAVVCAEALETVCAPEPVPPQLRTVLDQALSPDPALRHQSAETFRFYFHTALEDCLRTTRAFRPANNTQGLHHTSVMTPGPDQHDTQFRRAPQQTRSTWEFYLAPVIDSRQRMLAGLDRNEPRYIAGLLATTALLGIVLGGLAFLVITWLIVEIAKFV
ncbi:serine/threonine-protein kinase [Nocardia jejuensis]|uniref:serine/threonine-protein kinase n=1 Tax=Nocardia jejuensis TaxID=328049 RepID=UPI000A4FAB4B|nr:serine/threonine-protein kinase [Nocardia jejuensis]